MKEPPPSDSTHATQINPLQHPLLLPLHLTTLVLSLLLPPTIPYRREVSIALIIATYIPTILSPFSDDPATNYGVATLWTFTLRVLTMHVFSTSREPPEKMHYRVDVHGENKKEQGKSGNGSIEGNGVSKMPENSTSNGIRRRGEKDMNGNPQVQLNTTESQDELSDPTLYSLTFKKLLWVFHLLSSPRGIGWNYQIRHPPAPTSTSTVSYSISVLKHLLTLYLLLDVARTYSFLYPTLYIYPSDPPPGHLSSPGLIHTFLYTLSNGTLSSLFIQLQYTLLSLPFIFLFKSPPTNWPPLFGSITEAYTLGNLWGKVWHQLLRTTIVPWGNSACRLLLGNSKPDASSTTSSKNPTRSLAERIILVLVGFTMSALGHASAVYVGSRGQFGVDSLKFFGMQGVGVLIELLVIEAYKRWFLRGKIAENSHRGYRWERLVGYLWVLGWTTMTNKWQAGDMRRLGLALKAEPVPWSLVRWGLGWPQRPNMTV